MNSLLLALTLIAQPDNLDKPVKFHMFSPAATKVKAVQIAQPVPIPSPLTTPVSASLTPQPIINEKEPKVIINSVLANPPTLDQLELINNKATSAIIIQPTPEQIAQGGYSEHPTYPGSPAEKKFGGSVRAPGPPGGNHCIFCGNTYVDHCGCHEFNWNDPPNVYKFCPTDGTPLNYVAGMVQCKNCIFEFVCNRSEWNPALSRGQRLLAGDTSVENGLRHVAPPDWALKESFQYYQKMQSQNPSYQGHIQDRGWRTYLETRK